MTSHDVIKMQALTAMSEAAKRRAPGLSEDEYNRHAVASWDRAMFLTTFRHEHCRPAVDPTDTETSAMRYYQHKLVMAQVWVQEGDISDGMALQIVEHCIILPAHET